MEKKTPSKTRLEMNHNPLLADAFKTLLANIRFASVDEDIKTVMVTSSVPNEGKTTVAVNLAKAIATSGKNTLLVDTDMRRHSAGHVLATHPQYGLYAALSGEQKLNQVIHRTRIPQLFFMDSESSIPSPPDILSSKSFAALVDSLKESFDYVIFDSPPVSVFVDAAILATLVDGTLMVVKQGSTNREIALKSVNQLRHSNARLLGCVMNGVPVETSDYYYYYKPKETAAAPKRFAKDK
jgi:capsular exopolysaccharide synthesis family protein